MGMALCCVFRVSMFLRQVLQVTTNCHCVALVTVPKAVVLALASQVLA